MTLSYNYAISSNLDNCAICLLPCDIRDINNRVVAHGLTDNPSPLDHALHEKCMKAFCLSVKGFLITRSIKCPICRRNIGVNVIFPWTEGVKKLAKIFFRHAAMGALIEGAASLAGVAARTAFLTLADRRPEIPKRDKEVVGTFLTTLVSITALPLLNRVKPKFDRLIDDGSIWRGTDFAATLVLIAELAYFTYSPQIIRSEARFFLISTIVIAALASGLLSIRKIENTD
jgi:deoxycytidylate deaminase